MNGLIFGLGIFIIIVSISSGVAQDIFLSWLGVPSPSDIGEQIIENVPNEKAREIGMRGMMSARILENFPLFLLVAGIIIAIIGILVPG